MFRNAILPEADLYLYPPPPSSRIRYNISTGEYNGWNSAINGSIARVTKTGVLTNNINAQATTATNPTVRQSAQAIAISSLDVSSYLGFGLNTTEQYRVHTSGVRLFTL